MARKERERRYIAEYMFHEWPQGDWQLNVELGPIPQEYVDRLGLGKAAALFRPTRPRVDAVKWDKDRYYIIEAKIRDIKAGIGDLSYYQGMIPRTPDLPFYDGQEIVTRLIVPWMIEWIQAAADAAQVEVVTSILTGDAKIRAGLAPLGTVGLDSPPRISRMGDDMGQFMEESLDDLAFPLFLVEDLESRIQLDSCQGGIGPASRRSQSLVPFDRNLFGDFVQAQTVEQIDGPPGEPHVVTDQDHLVFRFV